ncbi:MAG: ferric enterobactin receptor [Kordia sp.]|nr:MAG: ferric enterobactin receptor [Kordia sp.]
MKQKKGYYLIIVIYLLLFSQFTFSQKQIKGVVKDTSGVPIMGANIIEKGTTNGIITDFNGVFSIEVQENATLEISYIGYVSLEISVTDKTLLQITLEEGVTLDDIVIVGSRAVLRSNTTSALPVDILSAKDLVNTGQLTFDKALQYKIPSFNTVQTPVNDATSLLDPYEIRNMGPSRTLVLINGKRKNLSALLYTQTSPGRGETGADISGIPVDAIKRIEILRDGASAQYGSDAIAGVINIILKDDYKNGSSTLRTGITGEGDGEMFGFSINNGSTLGKENGFINYTIDLSKVNLANRPGTVDAAGEYSDFYDGSHSQPITLQEVQNFLSRKPDAGNINGSPETATAKFLVNGQYSTSETTDMYFNAAYVYKKVNSFANYRTPYWRRQVDFNYLSDFFPTEGTPNNYDGYLPTFEGDLNDYNATIGFKSIKDGWKYDVSFTTGGNSQNYTVSNSHNRSDILDGNGDFLYQDKSPITFKPGGTSFSHNVGNIDISKPLKDNLAIGLGAEFRSETFEILPGDLASYDGQGADSFAGNRPENSGKFNRYNFGGYLDVAWDITNDFLVNGTIRTENYSDFGNAFVWKLSSRYKFIDDKVTLRASISTGFRAPTLHQTYTQKSQYSFVPGSGIQSAGLFNNTSPQTRLLGIEQLKPEESTNFTIGIGAKPTKKLNITIDYYSITVKDRIVLGAEIGHTQSGTTPLDLFLDNNDVYNLSFFSNAIDTRTSGLDFVVSYKRINIGEGKLNVNLSGNYTLENKRIGTVKNPKIVEDAGQSVINDTQEALFFTSRPKTKWIIGGAYKIGKFNFNLNNTYFGKTTFKQTGLDSNLRTEFIPKIVTDLGINFEASKEITLSLNINNILNVLPEWEFVAENSTGEAILSDPTQVKAQSNLITFNQRYSQMTYDGYHFSQLGTMFNFSLNYKF